MKSIGAKLQRLSPRLLIRLATLALCILAIEAGLRIWTPSALRMRSTRILLPTDLTIENRWDYDSD